MDQLYSKKKSMIKSMVLWSVLMVSQVASAQTLEKMIWFNEPEHWSIDDGALEMIVPAQTDYWRISHYGFTVDDAPFYYATYGGEFEAKVKVEGGGSEASASMIFRSASGWSVITLDRPVEYVWIKAVRRLDAIEIFYSFDDEEYTMMRNAWMEDNRPIQVGMMGACPDGNGFTARFEKFSVRHLPDLRRLQWLKNNAE